MEGTKKIIIAIVILIVGLAVGFGVNTLIVWGVCKIMGWTFAWKWVILFTIVYAVVHSCFTANAR